MSEVERMRRTLAQIAELAGAAAHEADADDEHGNGGGEAGDAPRLTCTLRALPERLIERAADVARTINPVNAPPRDVRGIDGPDDPLKIAARTAKYWGPAPRRLTVSFLERPPADLRRRIIDHLNAWTRTTGVSFVPTAGTGQVRISLGPGGYWSYLGTDILLIPPHRPTMNLEGFTMGHSESEFRRVVRHEAGHTLGFEHEHMRKALVDRIDPDKAYDYFLRTQGWDRDTVNQQVLRPLDEKTIMSTPPDQTSIMCYQLPGSITRDGKPILGGMDINRTDFAFAGKIYPKTGATPAREPASYGPESDVAHDGAHYAMAGADDWDPSEDVPTPVRLA